ncbi:MAG: hypothetical protein R3260_19130 [Pseudomonas sp.]|nr:hypothetical protein [Pseudomonas sp.]
MSQPQELRVAPLDKQDVQAIKALYRGDADEHQQRLALQVIVNKFSRAQDLLYIPSDTHGTTFLNGRAFVGAQILKCLNLPVGALITEGDKNVDNQASADES